MALPGDGVSRNFSNYRPVTMTGADVVRAPSLSTATAVKV